MPEDDHDQHYDGVLHRSKRLREDAAALRERSAALGEHSRRIQADWQRHFGYGDEAAEEREIDREQHGGHDPAG